MYQVLKNTHFKTKFLIVPLEWMKVIALFVFIGFVKKTMFVTSQGIKHGFDESVKNTSRGERCGK